MSLASAGPVVYAIYVNGMRIRDFPLDVRLDQTWDNHDLFTIRIEYNRLSNMSGIQPWPANALVQVNYGRGPSDINYWYGYVNHYQQSANADSGTQNLQLTYYCLGTSKPMNTVISKSWGSVSPTYIAKQMALKYHMRCVYTTTNYVLSEEVQANLSDFSYMNALASRTGYRFWVSGGTLYFIDPAVLLQGRSRQAVPTYRQDKLLTKQDTMRDFELLQGDNLPGSTLAQRTISGIDSTSGNLFTLTSGSGNTTLANTSQVAQSLGEAQDIMNAWQGLSQFWIGATAELFGDTLLYPGKVVYLDGTALPGGNIGYWIVVSATHILLSSGTSNPANDKYVTQCVLMRNSMAVVPSIKQTVVVSPEVVPCISGNGTWYSTSLQVIKNGIVNG